MSEHAGAPAKTCACPSRDGTDCAARRYGSDVQLEPIQPCECACHEADEEDWDDDGEREGLGRCHWCAGDGWTECSDPIQCTSEHNELGECRCGSCGGSGRAEDMTIW